MIRFIEEITKWGKLTPLYDWLGKRSFSQSGEDIVVDSILGRLKKGFYVDIGAYHPKIFSNTYLFYKRGWRGICVEPNPEAKWKFNLVRPRDVFVNVGVADIRSQITAMPAGRQDDRSQTGKGLQYFVFEEGAVNTFSEKNAKESIRVGRKLLRTINVPVKSMESILDEYLPNGQKIDLLNVDVEGMDLAVLKSNNWKKYRPKVVIAEEIRSQMTAMPAGRQDDRSQIGEYLEKLGYELVGMTGYSMVFMDQQINR